MPAPAGRDRGSAVSPASRRAGSRRARAPAHARRDAGSDVLASAACRVPLARCGSAYSSPRASAALRARTDCRERCGPGTRSWLRLLLCSVLRVKIQQVWPATIDVLAHLLAGRSAETLEVAVLELDARAATRLGDEAHLDLGCELRPRLGFPLGADFPGNDQALRWLPDAHVPDHHIAPVLVAGKPAATDEGLDDRFAQRTSA